MDAVCEYIFAFAYRSKNMKPSGLSSMLKLPLDVFVGSSKSVTIGMSEATILDKPGSWYNDQLIHLYIG